MFTLFTLKPYNYTMRKLIDVPHKERFELYAAEHKKDLKNFLEGILLDALRKRYPDIPGVMETQPRGIPDLLSLFERQERIKPSSTTSYGLIALRKSGEISTREQLLLRDFLKPLELAYRSSTPSKAKAFHLNTFRADWLKPLIN